MQCIMVCLFLCHMYILGLKNNIQVDTFTSTDNDGFCSLILYSKKIVGKSHCLLHCHKRSIGIWTYTGMKLWNNFYIISQSIPRKLQAQQVAVSCFCWYQTKKPKPLYTEDEHERLEPSVDHLLISSKRGNRSTNFSFSSKYPSNEYDLLTSGRGDRPSFQFSNNIDTQKFEQ
jgi:hypothetical protein